MTNFDYKVLVEVINGPRPSNQRHGQWTFNTVYSIAEEVGDELRATEVDPYYDDAKIPAFLEAIKSRYVK